MSVAVFQRFGIWHQLTLTQEFRLSCRGAGLKAALGGSWPRPSGGLVAPPPLGAAALLPPAWGLLLRLLVQQVQLSSGMLMDPAGQTQDGCIRAAAEACDTLRRWFHTCQRLALISSCARLFC